MVTILYDPIEWSKYDRVVDDITNIGNNVVLRFSVSLSTKEGGKRNHYYKEYEYESRYKDTETLITVRRSFQYYMSFENVKAPAALQKLQIKITPKEFFLLKNALDVVVSWFTDTKYDNLFMLVKGELALSSSIPSHVVKGFEGGKFIKFVPAVVLKKYPSEHKETGVMLEFHDGQTEYMTVDEFMALYYLYITFNMYQSAQNMLTYMEKPEPGTNRFEINPKSTQYNPARRTLVDDSKESEKTTGVNNRIVRPKGKYSNISDLE